MTTSAVSNQSIYQDIRAFHQNRSNDLKQLGQALQSGDLNAAQQAFDALTALGQGGPFSNAEPFRRSDRVTDFNAIGQALQSGDLNGAQSAFATLLATWGKHQTSPPVQQSPAAVVTFSPVPPTFQPPSANTPATQVQWTMPPTFQPPQIMPPTIEPQGTMPPTFQPPEGIPPATQTQGTMPPTFKPPEAISVGSLEKSFEAEA